MLPVTPKNGTELTCPVCGKTFKATDTTRYIIKNGFTCSWKCFKDQHIVDNKARWKKQQQVEQKVKTGEQKRRGRKKKDLKIDSAYNRFKAGLVNKETLSQSAVDKAVAEAFKEK